MFSKQILGFLFYLAIFFPSLSALSANELLSKEDNASGEEQIKALIDSLKAYRNINMESSIYFGRMAASAARKGGYQKLEAISLKNIGINYYFSAQADSAIKYYLKANAICEKINDKKGQANCLYNLGLVYNGIGHYDDAITYFERSKDIEKRLGDEAAIAKTLNAVGNLHQNLGDFKKAMQNYLNALRINERLGKVTDAAQNYNNLGALYYEMGHHRKALNYYKKALEIHSSQHNLSYLASSYNNIGAIYHMEMEDFEKALYYYLESIRLKKETGSMNNYALVLMNTGDVYSMMGNNKKAFEYLMQAKKRTEEEENQKLLVQVYNGLGMHYYRDKKYGMAKDYLNKGLRIATKIGQLNQIRNIHLSMVDVYSQQQMYKKALEHHKQYTIMHDSIADDDKEKRLTELEKKYQSEKKLKEIELLKKQNEIHKIENRKNLYTIYGLLGFILLLIIITALLIREWRLRQKHRTIALEQKLLRLQMNPHFIFNLLTAIQSYIYKNEHEKAGKYLSMFARLIRSVLEYSRVENISLDKEIQTLRYYLKLQQIRFSNNFEFEIKVSPEEEDTTSIYIPPMLAQPFIENSIEHGLEPLDKKGRIEVNFYIQEEYVILEIMDNGVGIKQYRKLNMTSEKKHQSLATSITADRLSLFKPVKGEKITLTIEDLIDHDKFEHGTRVLFKIPASRTI